MEKVFTSKDAVEAHFVRSLLEAQGIRAEVLGEMLGAARGELPYIEETNPAVWVGSDDVEEARVIVDEFVRRGREVPDKAAKPESWTCENCGEVIEGQFTQCWNCGGAREDGE